MNAPANKRIERVVFIHRKYPVKLLTITGPIMGIFLSVLISITSYGQKKLTPGQTFRDCLTCPEMIVVPAGNFTINSVRGDSAGNDKKIPERSISINQFAVSRFAITHRQWATFVAATKRKVTVCIEDGVSPKKQSDNDPVGCVSWKEVQEYMHWLNHKTGTVYRLLTEAEWEYIMHGGTNKAGPPEIISRCEIQPNTFQWVEDCFASSCSNGTIHGGNGSTPSHIIRAAYREWVPTPGTTIKDYRSPALGFRVAKTL
jgi:formylglycine-generating enzyme required for sulfatase activity